VQLVKPGQLNKFNQQRNEVIRQRLRQLEQIYQERREVQVKKPAKPAPRRNGLWNQIVDYEDTTTTGGVSIGARVIVKEKYNGTCRYIGPIQETYASEEIFVGVELDQKLTQNNGKFGSQIYFNCANGHGLMVPINKVRVIPATVAPKQAAADTRSMNSFASSASSSLDDERARNLERAMSIKRSKSVADLSGQVKTTNWMRSPDVKRKVSTGFMSLSRSKSSSNLASNNSRGRGADQVDPRAVLDQVKRMQPAMNAMPQHGEYHNQFQSSEYHQSAPTVSYGASEYAIDQTSQAAAASVADHHQNTLRQSFSRILNVRPAAQKQQYSTEPLSTPFSYARSSHVAAAPVRLATESFSDMRSEISFSSASDIYRRQLQATRAPSIVSYGSLCATCTACSCRSQSYSAGAESHLQQQRQQQRQQQQADIMSYQQKQQNEMIQYQQNQERMRKMYEQQE